MSVRGYEVIETVTSIDVSSADSLAQGKALYIGGAGDVKIDTTFSTGVTFKAVPAGSILPVAVNKVYTTGTSATEILVLS